jgi:hypothetical protein
LLQPVPIWHIFYRIAISPLFSMWQGDGEKWEKVADAAN